MEKELSKRELELLRPVRLIVDKNPKKEGSQAWTRFQGYFAIKADVEDVTIKDCYEAGLRGDDIRHDQAHGFILVGDEAIDNYDRSKPREMVEGDL